MGAGFYAVFTNHAQLASLVCVGTVAHVVQ